MTNKKTKYILNEQGQALLFVIVALTIALAVGLAASSRTVSSIKRSTNIDTSARAYSAAEGGGEWFLRQPENVLDALSDGNTSSQCPTGTTSNTTNTSCILTFTSASGDNITSRATVSVSPFKFNSQSGLSPSHRYFDLNQGEVKEIRLYEGSSYYNGNLNICWQSQDTSVTSDLYIIVYNANGEVRRLVINNSSTTNSSHEGFRPSSMHVTAVASTYSNYPYSYCYNYTVPGGTFHPRGLRVKSLYGRSLVGVVPSNAASFPGQGYMIVSRGELLQDNVTKISKTVTTYRSLKYLPAIFDYAVYTNGDLIRF
jgi:hypothetical protein